MQWAYESPVWVTADDDKIIDRQARAAILGRCHN